RGSPAHKPIRHGRCASSLASPPVAPSTSSRASLARRFRSVWITGTTPPRPLPIATDPILPQITGYAGESVSDSGNRHAFLAPVPRRAACPAPGVGGRRPPCEAAQGRAGVEGALAIQQGEDAVVLRQRPEAGVVRLLLRQERL